ncbi:hypothetical protein NP493_245g01000 [Ridgeia piscesae]|uniref:Uncharacterized protein n=1 Tax=Ridgeia piscesae TaxID=27915 RepID=A0AAD9UDB8_RIDPI|nr:hypothetical protein NP493_245g01000 [Ridgeia piscesae]
MLKNRPIDYVGAWSFLLLSLGIFLLPFSSLLCSHYSGTGSDKWTLSVALLCTCLGLITVGTCLLVAWCLKGGPKPPSKGDDLDLPLSRVCGTSESGTSQLTMTTCAANGGETTSGGPK